MKANKNRILASYSKNCKFHWQKWIKILLIYYFNLLAMIFWVLLSFFKKLKYLNLHIFKFLFWMHCPNILNVRILFILILASKYQGLHLFAPFIPFSPEYIYISISKSIHLIFCFWIFRTAWQHHMISILFRSKHFSRSLTSWEKLIMVYNYFFQ